MRSSFSLLVAADFVVVVFAVGVFVCVVVVDVVRSNHFFGGGGTITEWG